MCIPKAPKMPAPPPPPKIPQAASEVSPSVLAAKRRAKTTAAAQSGFQSTILTSGRGVTSGAGTAQVSLLGDRGASKGSTVGRQPKATAAVQKTQPVGQDQEELRRRLINAGAIGRAGGRGSGTQTGGSGTILGGGGTYGGGGGGGRKYAFKDLI